MKGYTGDINPPIGSISGVFNFTIVPSPSALDLGNGNVNLSDSDYKAAYNGVTPPNYPKNSPFANFITAYKAPDSQNGNEYHLQFTQRNSNWLAAELTNSQYNASCSYLCSNAQIAGSTTLCSAENYSVQAGASSYNWSIIGGNSNISISGNGTPNITLSNIGAYNGLITLSVILGDGNSLCGTVTLTKNIWIGSPAISVDQIDNSNYYNDNEAHFFLSDYSGNPVNLNDQGITQIKWTKISSNPPTVRLFAMKNYPQAWAIGDNNSWYMEVKVEVTNACGTTEYVAAVSPPMSEPCKTYILAKSSSTENTYVVMYSPTDPCNGNKNSSNPFSSNNNTSNKVNDEFNIKVANSMGVIIIDKVSDSFDLSSYPTGTYIVNITKDSKVIINQTIVKY
ncbi:hypothetical protein SAMN05660477_03139 [Soonwooa buanensis]|uniref:PKD-like domain-containing protein n=1 Tax=Soonwooa buanensis TaxID=619805 RepID=A0A1T5GU43_9FLAO|nr:hypothetical protein [Soonwooa buanensis]SKC11906.1 hypothetical protein SAMN05660477_03139 [Soonwooa buanensis]